MFLCSVVDRKLAESPSEDANEIDKGDEYPTKSAERRFYNSDKMHEVLNFVTYQFFQTLAMSPLLGCVLVPECVLHT